MVATTEFRKTWDEVTGFWGSVSLDEPDVIVDKKRAEKEMGDEIAFIDMETRKIKVNHPNMTKEVGSDKLKPIEEHEVGHHKFCPYDLKTNITLLNEADKVLRNIEQAKYAENIFADILSNTHIINKGDKSIIGVYQRLAQKNNGNEFWDLYMRTCEKIWKLPDATLAKHVEEKTECDAKKLEDIVSDVMYKHNDWPKGMHEFAKIVKDYIKKNFANGKTGQAGKGQGSGQSQGSGGSSGNQQQNKKQSPADRGLIDEHSPKDFAPNRGKKDKAGEAEVEKELRGLAKKTGCDPKRYRRLVAGTGLGNRKSALKWFYRDLASCFDIDMPEIISNNSYEVPETFTEWDIHDEEKNLDIPYSASQHGVIIPGHTTYQQKHKKGEFGQRNRTSPDLIICLDSSGSMPDPIVELSPAVLSAMVAARKALNMDRRVAVINFSTEYDVLDYTRDKSKIDDMIVKYFNGGTDIPGYELLAAVQKNKQKQHILIISDTEISNLGSEMTYLREAIDCAKTGGTIFLINPNAGSSKQLEKIGYDVIRVTNPNDLVGLTLKKTKSIYGV